jgi:hypothetical protein
MQGDHTVVHDELNEVVAMLENIEKSAPLFIR